MKNPRLAASLNLVPLGFGYLYLGHPWVFAATFVGGIGAVLVGFLLGPVAIDWLLMLLFAECGYTFSVWCPGERPMWSSIVLVLVWSAPPALVAVLTTWNALIRATAINAAAGSP